MNSSSPISHSPKPTITAPGQDQEPYCVPEPEPEPSSIPRRNPSTISLPILHPLNTIPEAPPSTATNRTATLPVTYTSNAGMTPIRPSGRHSAFRYPVYPETPYSYSSSGGPQRIPYTTQPGSGGGARAPYTPGVSNPTTTSSSPFFVWPSRLPRALTSSRNKTKSFLPTTTADKPLPNPAGVKKHPPPSPAETEITREFQHEIRLEARRRKEEFPRRLLTALFGGAAVVVPMVVMSLSRSLVRSLVTSSVAMLVFGVVLAWTSAADEASLMVATAGYAAVLAVFVAVGDGGA